MKLFVFVVIACFLGSFAQDVAMGTLPEEGVMAKDQKNPVVMLPELMISMKNPEVYVIDARSYSEVASGKIEGAATWAHIPSTYMKWAFSQQPGCFKRYFLVDKPSKTSEIIFYCESGSRSKKAMEDVMALGYTGARYFDGTMKDYYTYLVAQASAGGPM